MTNEEMLEVKNKIHSLKETKLEELSISWQVRTLGLIGCSIVLLGFILLAEKLYILGWSSCALGLMCAIFSFVYQFVKSRLIINRYTRIDSFVPFQLNLTKDEFESLYLNRTTDKL